MYVDQAKAFMGLKPPDDAFHAEEESLLIRVQATVELAVAPLIGDQGVVETDRVVGTANDIGLTVRVWFSATRDEVTCFAVEVSLDGGRSFLDPLPLVQGAS